MSKICIIIPVYNEEFRWMASDFTQHLQAHPNHTLLFVNDCSTDNTEIKIKELQQKFPEQVKSISLNKNQGKAEAVRIGFMEAFKSDYQVVGFLDADLATPLSEVDSLVEKLSDNPKYFMVFGSRIKLLNLDLQRNLKRHYLGRIFATYVSLLFDWQIYDTQCGAKFFTNNEKTNSIFSRPFISKWFFDVEIFLRLQQISGRPLEQIALESPLNQWIERGKSKLKFSDFFSAPFQLLRIKSAYKSRV
ncbi:MAG: glycosyltransferase [Bacteroidales bacterium]|nr:glycosyltransferase [Bacteroidales bacterium]